jgi:hypothetical protein
MYPKKIPHENYLFQIGKVGTRSEYLKKIARKIDILLDKEQQIFCCALFPSETKYPHYIKMIFFHDIPLGIFIYRSFAAVAFFCSI